MRQRNPVDYKIDQLRSNSRRSRHQKCTGEKKDMQSSTLKLNSKADLQCLSQTTGLHSWGPVKSTWWTLWQRCSFMSTFRFSLRRWWLDSYCRWAVISLSSPLDKRMHLRFATIYNVAKQNTIDSDFCIRWQGGTKILICEKMDLGIQYMYFR